MKVFGLDGRTHIINLEKNRTRGIVSNYHEKARELLKETFPMIRIVEEMPIPGAGNNGLFADFFIPGLKMVVEVHGEQHYKYIKHFHGDINGFKASKKRDSLKKEWCKMNNIEYVELSYKDDINEWKRKITDV